MGILACLVLDKCCTCLAVSAATAVSTSQDSDFSECNKMFFVIYSSCINFRILFCLISSIMGQYVAPQWVCGLELPVTAARTIFIVETVSLHSHLSANIILLIFMVFVMCYVWNIIFIYHHKNSHRNRVSAPNRWQSEILSPEVGR